MHNIDAHERAKVGQAAVGYEEIEERGVDRLRKSEWQRRLRDVVGDFDVKGCSLVVAEGHGQDDSLVAHAVDLEKIFHRRLVVGVAKGIVVVGRCVPLYRQRLA